MKRSAIPKGLKGIAVAALFIATAAPAKAADNSVEAPGFSFLTGNKLFSYCSSKDTSQKIGCISYIMGVTDSMGTGEPVHGWRACFDPSINGFQIQDVVINSAS